MKRTGRPPTVTRLQVMEAAMRHGWPAVRGAKAKTARDLRITRARVTQILKRRTPHERDHP